MKKKHLLIPENVLNDKNLTINEKYLYAQIICFCKNNRTCFASNKYFSNIFSVSTRSISRWLKKLVQLGYIKNESTNKKSNKRYISIIDKNNHRQNVHEFIDKMSMNHRQNVHNINKDINKNNNINIITKKPKKVSSFQVPKIEEVIKYFAELGSVNATKDGHNFYDYNECRGWMIGKNKMKKWKAGCNVWYRKSKEMNKPINISKPKIVLAKVSNEYQF